ncbi:hypothetical protein SAMN05444521_8137 [Streptomyces sp. 3214.6]|nr:hypothetical protein SAMN05444521_8137 [Streptomyces sp. 3214.6]
MIRFILAGALGAIALIVYLLFRQLRELSWQLTQLRVERDSERILREIGIRSDSRPVMTTPTDAPARRKGHLSLYLGAGLAPALMGLRDIYREHRPALVAGGAAASVAIGAAALLLATNLDHPPPGVEGPAAPPTQAVSPEPSAPGKQPSRGPAPPLRTLVPSSGPGTPADDVADGAAVVTSLQLPPVPVESTAGTPPRSSPSGGSPPTTAPPPTEPSAPVPSTSSTSDLASPVPVLCVKARTLLELELCLRA